MSEQIGHSQILSNAGQHPCESFAHAELQRSAQAPAIDGFASQICEHISNNEPLSIEQHASALPILMLPIIGDISLINPFR